MRTLFFGLARRDLDGVFVAGEEAGDEGEHADECGDEQLVVGADVVVGPEEPEQVVVDAGAGFVLGHAELVLHVLEVGAAG